MTNIYDTLKALATTNGWGFIYGRRDYNNLFHEVEDKDKVYLFLDPVQIDGKYDEYNALVEDTFNGYFMLLKSSDFGKGYDYKYEDDIKPLITEKLQIIWNTLSDQEYGINVFRTTEVINEFDYNYDGILVNYSLTHRYD